MGWEVMSDGGMLSIPAVIIAYIIIFILAIINVWK
tara:strand:+ start:923 stop:1027 length:105 start_codon:yes stop_codon:yes gene_type:complete